MTPKIFSRAMLVLLVLSIFCTGLVFAADKYPSKPITVIVTFGPGGLSDIGARLNGKYMEPALGQPFKVICKPGGGTIPGVMAVMKAPKDGYTLLRMAAPSMVTQPLVRKTPHSYKDFVPLFIDVKQSNVLYVKADAPYKDLKDFVAAAKKKTMLMGINQIGAPPHLSGAQFADEFGITVKMITYKQIPASIVGMLGGHVDCAIGQLLQNKQYGGKIRPLAILDKTRNEKYLPGVPTVSEVFPGKKAGSWIHGGLAVLRGTPDSVINKLVNVADKTINTPEFKKEQESKNIVSHYVSGPEACTKLIEEGIALYKPIVDKLGIKK